MGGHDSTTPSSASRNEVFISYSRRDATWLERLRVHLEPLVHRDRLHVWDDTRILPGSQWADDLREALARARVAVLLVSPDYLASPFISQEELGPILRASASDGLQVFWIPVRASIADKTELSRLQAAHPPERPLAGLRGAAVDGALAAIARAIVDAFDVPPSAPSSPTASVELQSPGASTVPFTGDQVTFGRAVGNDLALTDDEASRWHAVCERFGAYWYIRDLSSRNGTLVNGERVLTERRLLPGDRITIGRTTMVFHSDSPPPDATTTRFASASPALLDVERRVLVALARPLATGGAAAGAATDEQIAGEVGLAATDVVAHLASLVDKFGVDEGPAQRTRLAEEAFRRGAIAATAINDRSITAG